MMKYAIIQSGGKQYLAEEGKDIVVDKLDLPKEKEYIFPQVLFVHDESNIHIGTPYLENVNVLGKILGEEKGKKLYISKFKAKVHYRRRMGFRSLNTRIRIERIESGKPSEAKPVKTKSAPKLSKTN